jgi:hypothetical protein
MSLLFQMRPLQTTIDNWGLWLAGEKTKKIREQALFSKLQTQKQAMFPAPQTASAIFSTFN